MPDSTPLQKAHGHATSFYVGLVVFGAFATVITAAGAIPFAWAVMLTVTVALAVGSLALVARVRGIRWRSDSADVTHRRLPTAVYVACGGALVSLWLGVAIASAKKQTPATPQTIGSGATAIVVPPTPSPAPVYSDPDLLAWPHVTLNTTDEWPYTPRDRSENRAGLHRQLLRIENTTDAEIRDVVAKLQLPEPIVRPPDLSGAKGAEFSRCTSGRMTVLGGHGPRGGGARIDPRGPTGAQLTVTNPGDYAGLTLPIPKLSQCDATEAFSPTEVTGIWQLTLDRLPARRSVEIAFVTSNSVPTAQRYVKWVHEHETDSLPTALRPQLFYLDGLLAYQHPGRAESVNFHVYVTYDGEHMYSVRRDQLPANVDPDGAEVVTPP